MPRKERKSSSPLKYPVKSSPLQAQPPLTTRAPQSSFFGTIKEGFAFGIGSSIARNIFASPQPVSQPATQPVTQPATQPTPSEIEKMTFTQCMDKTAGNYEECGHLE